MRGHDGVSINAMVEHEQRAATTLGRETEFDAVEGFVRAVPVGPGVLVLHGEPGIGKTTVWNQGVASARELSYAVMTCRPTQAESELPYLGLGDLFSSVPDQILATPAGPQRRALDVALLRAESEGSALHQRTVAVAVLNVLRETSRSAPALVAVDDAQWLDLPSRRVLQFALRRLDSAPVGFLVATRSGIDLSSEPAARHISIGPLSAGAIAGIVRSRVGAHVPARVLRRVTEGAGGNPLFALELIRAVLDSPPDAIDPARPLNVPASLNELLGARLARLPKATRDCLLMAAALSRPTVELLQRAQTNKEDVGAALTAAVDAGVVVIRRGSITFLHPLLAGVLYAQAPGTDLRELHRRLAHLVQDPEERARHLGLSAVAPDEGLAAAIALGGSSAARRGAPDVAAALFEKAARLTPGDSHDAAALRLLDAADQHIALRELAQARRLLDEAVASVPAGVIRARALHGIGRVVMFEEGGEAMTAALLEALPHAGDDLALMVALEGDLVFARTQVGDPAGSLQHARAAYAAAERSGRDELLAEALDQLCMAEFVGGNGVPKELLDRAVNLDQRLERGARAGNPGLVSGRFLLAMVLKWTNRFDEARRILKSHIAAMTDRADEGSLDTALFYLGELELWAGNWNAVAGICATAEELQMRTGLPVVVGRKELLIGLLACARGDIDAARSACRRYAEHVGSAPDPPGLLRTFGIFGRLELSMRHASEAAEQLMHAVAIESRAGYDPAVLRVLHDAVEALIEAGRQAEAESHLLRLEAQGAKPSCLWTQAAALRCRALMDEARGDFVAAAAGIEESSAMFERLGDPFERGRSLLALGTLLRRQKKKRAARETLDQALSIFEALGAESWARATRAELNRIGGRAPSPHALTPTEARIAELVADGLTNREAAASMFLSEKTIETNLTRIYEKLAVQSRRELARKLHTPP